jgi:hypothetical protein
MTNSEGSGKARIHNIFSLVVIVVLLHGCAVGLGTIDQTVDKEFTFSELNKIVPGTSEAQLIELLGKPSAFGVDEKGREFLLYRITRQSQKAVAVSALVASGVEASTVLKGFEVRIHIKDGLVQTVGYTRYQE